MIVYITTNLINGKKYIGKDEKNNPDYLGSGIQLSAAIEKYGRDSFIKEILAYGINKQDLNELEAYYIDYYNAQKSNLFYNIAPGGTGGKVAENYNYRERPIYELNKESFSIIEEYKSSKEAHIKTGLNYKCLNAVCNGNKKSVKNRLFIFQDEYEKFKNSIPVPHNQKYLHISLSTGIFYFDLEGLYKAEFNYISSFSAFKNKVFKNKSIFQKKFITERI